MHQLIADFIFRMGLAFPVAILVGVKAGQMIHILNTRNMETQIADVTIETLHEKISYQLEILLRVYRDSHVDVQLPPDINLKNIVENLLFTDDPILSKIIFLNEIYMDLLNQSTQSRYFELVLQYILSD